MLWNRSTIKLKFFNSNFKSDFEKTCDGISTQLKKHFSSFIVITRGDYFRFSSVFIKKNSKTWFF